MLGPRPGETFADCTAGLGGHASLIGRRLGPAGTVVLNDLDSGNLERAARSVSEAGVGSVQTFRGNFAALPRRMEREGLRAHMVLADLGFASTQMDDPSRGLSFRGDDPLDMRFDTAGPTTAADLVATSSEPDLARILWEFGEEKASRQIARKLVEARRRGPIETTGQLAEIVRSVVRSGGGIDPATRTFQALRIAVNDELGSLDGLLAGVTRAARSGGSGWLTAGARIAIVSFHSLEDRMVKRAFGGIISGGMGEAVGDQPTTPTETERLRNPRSRSAKLRAIRLVSPDAQHGSI